LAHVAYLAMYIEKACVKAHSIDIAHIT
jgi:hypothetical protein